MQKPLIMATGFALALGLATNCAPRLLPNRAAKSATLATYINGQNVDSVNIARQNLQTFFADTILTEIITQTLLNNQELNATRLEVEVARQEIRARKGEYLPFVGVQGLAGVEKTGRYTVLGASEEANQIAPGLKTPKVVPNYMVGAVASWEVDVWRRLRNARQAAAFRYLASVEGRNFLVTNLVSEIASTYYELLGLDAQLALLRRNLDNQTNALATVRAQKESARVTELAVRRFEAQVFKTRSIQFELQQNIVEAENRLNFLTGRYPQTIIRNAQTFSLASTDTLASGIPTQLLLNRPDVRQAEAQLAAANLDVRVARANFYPKLSISAFAGYQAFNPSFLITTPESIVAGLAGSLAAPLINRNGIKAAYFSANARQLQAVYTYERTLLNAYIEVANQLSSISNLRKSYTLQNLQVTALNESSDIANNLFNSARADYLEVLLTQRDALESSFQLVETRMQQLKARVALYRALGGGWRP
jgi:outer membrane protein, multidrug efflux system